MAAIATQNIGGMTYYDDGNGNLVDYLGRPAPGSDANQPQGQGSNYTQGVTAQSLIDPSVTNTYNPQQLATPDAAAKVAQQTGLKQSQTSLEGPGVPDTPIQQVGASNAGLAQGVIDRYGPPTPGSLSEYLIQRDQPGNVGTQQYGSYNNYYNSAPVQTKLKAPAKTTTNSSVVTPPLGGGTTQPPGGAPYGYGNTDPVGDARRAAALKAAGGAGASWKTNTKLATTTGGRIDTSGLKVTKTGVNDAYTGTIMVDGKSVTVAITPDGRVFDTNGQDISSTFNPTELNSLRGAFQDGSGDPAYKPGGAGQTQTPGNTPAPPPTGPGRRPDVSPYVRQSVQGPGIPGSSGGTAQAPNAGYAPRETPAAFTGGNERYPLGVKPMLTQQDTPEHENAGEGLQYKTENDRALAIQRGEAINADLQTYGDQQYAEAGDFSDLQGAAYSGIANGQGGRSGDEKNAILRQDELSSLQQTPEEAQQNYLTGDEQTGILGDTGAAYHQLGVDEAGIDKSSTNRDQYARNEYYQGRDATNAALGSQDTGVRNALAGYKGDSTAALFGEAANARAYLDPNALNTSGEYNQNYNFGAREEQDIVDKAGRTVGAGAQADEDRILSEANAQGNTSPLALEAARNRVRQGGRVGAADAMTDARIQAKELALQTAQQKENTRLGAAQNYANLGTGTELNLGQDAMSMESQLGAAAIGAESYLGDQHVKAQQALGQQGTQLEKDLGQSHIDIGTKGAEMNLSAGQAADAANSARQGQIATNRQATSVGNQNTQYTRGKAAYDAESAANKDFSDQRLTAEQEYRKTLADRQAQAAQNTTIANQQRIGNYGTQTNATNTASGNAIVNSKTPSSTEKILTGIAGLVGGAKGLVTPGPQRALIGERGPELEIDIAKLPHYGYGYDPIDEYGTAPSYVTGSGETETEGNGLPGGTVSQNRPNPLWKNIVNTITPGGYQPFKPEQVDDSPNPIGKKEHHGGLLRKIITGGMYAEGGIVDGAHNEEIAPGISYVDHPQIKTLGQNGHPTAIIPLIRRPGNKLGPEDIPRLAEEYQYGHYGRNSYAR